MIFRWQSIPLILSLLILFSPASALAEVRIVPLSSFTKQSSYKSQSARVSAASVAAMMETIRYKGEGILSGVFSSSGTSKIDKVFSSDNSSQVFNSEEMHALSAEISEAAARLKPQESIVFITHASRVKGYVFFSGDKSIWYLAAIDGNPAHKVEQIEDPAYLPDDPDVRWRNKVEKTYWTLVPQAGQSLLSGRRDLLMVPVVQVAAVEQPKPAAAAAPATAAPAVVIPESDHWARIERLNKLLSRELISASEYKEKLDEIIVEFNQANPAVESQLDLIKQLRDRDWMDEPTYQAHRQKLLEKL